MRIRPDGFTGALMAVESVDDARAILHGPGGCRLCHSILSRKVYPRMEKIGTMEYNLPYFYGQPRIPCTYLDENDYINGAFETMRDALSVVESKNDKMVVVIDSPGAALIGDDHEKAIRGLELNERAFSIDESLISVPLSTGYDRTIRSILEWLSPEKTKNIQDGVNLIGMSVMDKDWKNEVREVRKNIELMGLKVVSTPGAGCSVEDLRRSVNASYNIVVYPEYGLNVAEFYRDRYGIPYVISEMGAPVGFDATEAWIRNIADQTSVDPGRAIDRIASHKKDVFDILMGSRFETIRLRGSTFSICGDASVVYPLTKWLYSYLSLTPVAVATDPGSYQPFNDRLKDFLISVDAGGSWCSEPVESDFIFADGDSSMMFESSGVCIKGIDIGMPTIDHNSIIPRPILGVKGGMYIIDEIIRSM